MDAVSTSSSEHSSVHEHIEDVDHVDHTADEADDTTQEEDDQDDEEDDDDEGTKAFFIAKIKSIFKTALELTRLTTTR